MRTKILVLAAAAGKRLDDVARGTMAGATTGDGFNQVGKTARP